MYKLGLPLVFMLAAEGGLLDRHGIGGEDVLNLATLLHQSTSYLRTVAESVCCASPKY